MKIGTIILYKGPPLPQLATYGDIKYLVEQIGADNLTPDLGGTLSYDHSAWVSNRLVSLE